MRDILLSFFCHGDILWYLIEIFQASKTVVTEQPASTDEIGMHEEGLCESNLTFCVGRMYGHFLSVLRIGHILDEIKVSGRRGLEEGT